MLTEQQLIAYLEDTLSPAERKTVETELEQDPQARRQLVQQARLDAALRATLGPVDDHERVKRSVLAVLQGGRDERLKSQILADTAELNPQPSVWNWLAGLVRRPVFGLGFACVLVLALVWFGQRTPTMKLEMPSRIELAGVVQLPKPGETIRAPVTGSATVSFQDGTVLHLEPGTEISFVPAGKAPRAGGKQLKLLAGSLSADVAKQPEGLPLLIETPHALAVVVGTEFDLSVATNQTELEVTEGLVRMSGKLDTSTVSVAAGEFAVATPRAALRYGRLARNPYLWPFSSASIWNRPLGGGAQFAPVPGEGLLADGARPGGMRSRRPAMGGPRDRLRGIWVAGERVADARLADANLPGSRLADSLVLLQSGRRHAFELRGVTARADGDLEAQAIARTDLAGPGAGDSPDTAKPFGLSNLGGLLHADELENGIHHALSARIPRARLGGRNDFQTPSTIWPAGGGDAPSAGMLNVGTLLAIPPGVDIKARFGESGPAYELARAMQDYGVYVTGFGDAPFILLRAEGRLTTADEEALLNQLVPLLQVVTNNTPATPGGGGTARREKAPALLGESE